MTTNSTTPVLGQRVGVRWGFDGSGVEMRFAGQVVGFEMPSDLLLVEVDPMVTDEPLRVLGAEVIEHKGNRIVVVEASKVSDAGQPARVASFGWLD